jgi:hypothetical protein
MAASAHLDRPLVEPRVGSIARSVPQDALAEAVLPPSTVPRWPRKVVAVDVAVAVAVAEVTAVGHGHAHTATRTTRTAFVPSACSRFRF